MKPYSNKTDRIDSRKCLYSEIRGNKGARKTAARFQAKKEINNVSYKRNEYTKTTVNKNN